MRPIGLFGGAFSPFHNGHLRLAIEALEQLGLYQMRLAPTAHPPHRAPSRISGARRLAWVESAVRAVPGLVADDRELLRDGPSYTVETLRELKTEWGERPLVLIMGADAFAHFHTWKDWETILDLAHLGIAARPGSTLAPPPETAVRLAKSRLYRAEDLRDRPAGAWMEVALPALDISSTRIRRLLAEGRSPRGLLPDAVYDALTDTDRADLAAEGMHGVMH